MEMKKLAKWTDEEQQLCNRTIERIEDAIVAKVFYGVMSIRFPPLAVLIPLNELLEVLYWSAYMDGHKGATPTP